MTGWLGAIVFAIGFVLLLRTFDLVDQTKRVVELAYSALQTICSEQLSDEQKASQLQMSSLRLLGLFSTITIGAISALALPLGIMYLVDACGGVPVDDVLSIVASPSFLVASTVGMLTYMACQARSRHGV